MSLPDARRLEAALEATWPAAASRPVGPFTFRDGQGGGRRVSAATAEGEPDAAAVAAALAAFAAEGRPALFRLRPGQGRLDAALAALGLARADPTLLLAAPVAAVARRPAFLAVLPAATPLAVMVDLWAEGGVGPERLAVMARAPGPKTALLAREDDHPAGAAFVALDGAVAMLHALTVSPRFRRRGVAARLVQAAAHWAAEAGATTFAVATVEANTAARALFAALGLAEAGGYWYRTA